MMAEDNLIDIRDLPKPVLNSASQTVFPNHKFPTLQELQSQHLHHVLEFVEGDKTRAAEILGISRSTLYNLLSRNKT
jgi:transcriptional regulator of acetoin/glycerol metabolism